MRLDGGHTRYSPQFTYYWGPFGAMGEYVRSSTDVRRLGATEQFENDAWQLALHYVLTGENASYRGVVPRSPFSPEHGTWGAFEIAARYHELHVDPDAFSLGFADPLVSAEDAEAWGVGVNWYMNRWLKLVLDFERTRFDGGGGAVRDDRETESAILFRMQLAY